MPFSLVPFPLVPLATPIPTTPIIRLIVHVMARISPASGDVVPVRVSAFIIMLEIPAAAAFVQVALIG